MPFREKSAWIMSVALILVGMFYFYSVAVIWSQSGHLAQPVLPPIVAYTVGLVALSIVGHVTIALLAPKDANARPDERDRQVSYRAGHYSSFVIASGIVTALGLYLFSHDGDLLFYTVFGSLMIGQIMEYAFQIFLYRNSI